MRYAIYVDDHAHYADESRRRALGHFDSRGAALAAAKRIVDAYLEQAHEPGMSADALFRSYTTFGKDPFILSDDADCTFSAWDYARERCRQLCGEPQADDARST